MARKLLIVESPAKARTIGKILGRDFDVKASVGHVRDLPKNTIGVDEANDFEPKYEILPDKQKVVADLRRAANKADEIYVATDPDREGEAICWHILELLKSVDQPMRRIEFHEITKRAVIEALEESGEVDMNRVNAQQARRVIDRLMGYRLSPLLWDKVKRGLSAGRVQSVALKMICDRDAEIKAFVSDEYWLVDASLEGSEKPDFTVRLSRKAGKKWRPAVEAEARHVESTVKNSKILISKATRKTRSQRPKAPFITSHLQQEAARRLRYPVRRTMQLAQRLYEGVDLGSRGVTGLITYMRTDSVRVSEESISQARAYIEDNYGPSFVPAKPHTYKNRSSSQDAHEAIRPTDVSLTPESLASILGADELRLYRMIWQRFVAAQMVSATFDITQVDVSAGEYVLQVTGKVMKDPGFLRLWKDVDSGDEKSPPLPGNLEVGQELKCLGLTLEQKFTQPPPRFSEASLVKALEENGIGRPSTYASIIATLSSRDYTVREKGNFTPTELGKLVNRLLIKSFSNLINEGYTAHLEEELDRVAEGAREWKELIRSFAGQFSSDLETAQVEMEQVKGKGVPTDQICPECSSPLVMKFGRYGEFLACSSYPECGYTRDLRDENEEADIEGEAPKCPDCESEMVIKRSRFGPFWACSRYPECRGTAKIGGEKKTAAAVPTSVACGREKCAGEIVERRSRRGRVFYGCSTYPKCDYSMWDFPVSYLCPECGNSIMGIRETKSRGREYICPVKECAHRMPEPEDAPTLNKPIGIPKKNGDGDTA